MLPLFAIPTTCGTGSEISPAAVITDPDSHYKHLMLNCTPNVAILDPNLVAKMPPPITAATGMDALTHAIEAYVNPGNTPFTRMFATRAIQQISKNLRQAVNGPDRPAALKNMLYAADIAGQSMAQGLGQVHGLSHVVSGRLGTPHGVANAILLSQVLEYHKDFLAEQLLEIAPLMGINAFGMPADKAGDRGRRRRPLAAQRHQRHVEAQRRRDEGVGHPAVRRGRAEVAGHLHRRAATRHRRGPQRHLQERALAARSPRSPERPDDCPASPLCSGPLTAATHSADTDRTVEELPLGGQDRRHQSASPEQMPTHQPGALTAPHVLEYPYTRSVGPVLGRFFTELRERRIVGVRTATGACSSRRRSTTRETGDARRRASSTVGPAGVVTTWAWVHAPARRSSRSTARSPGR